MLLRGSLELADFGYAELKSDLSASDYEEYLNLRTRREIEFSQEFETPIH